jgi:hypothetical protein
MNHYFLKMRWREIFTLYHSVEFFREFVALPPAPPRLTHGQQVRITGGPLEGHHGLWAGQATHERERVLLELGPRRGAGR